MSICCCTLAGTRACLTCPNNSDLSAPPFLPPEIDYPHTPKEIAEMLKKTLKDINGPQNYCPHCGQKIERKEEEK